MIQIRGRISGNTIILDQPTGLTDGTKVSVHIEPLPTPNNQPRKAGLFKDEIWMADDFDDIPPGFEEYT